MIYHCFGWMIEYVKFIKASRPILEGYAELFWKHIGLMSLLTGLLASAYDGVQQTFDWQQPPFSRRTVSIDINEPGAVLVLSFLLNLLPVPFGAKGDTNKKRPQVLAAASIRVIR